MKYLNFVLIALLFVACRSEEKQLEKDIEAIKNYLSEKNLTAESTASGLHYVVINEGTGNFMPDLSAIISVKYKGTFLDGEIFEKNDDDPIEFDLVRVIDGWIEGLQLMKKGAKYQFLIPSKLAYGELGNVNIGPNTPLFFEIELVDFTTEEIIFQEQLEEIKAYAEDKGYNVEETASGLHYVVVDAGDGGDMPTIQNEVQTVYRGELLSGEVFDESDADGIIFELSGVIQGWQEGVQLMSKNSNYLLIIPSRLAYGTQGFSTIPPNSPLFFDITLLDF